MSNARNFVQIILIVSKVLRNIKHFYKYKVLIIKYFVSFGICKGETFILHYLVHKNDAECQCKRSVDDGQEYFHTNGSSYMYLYVFMHSCLIWDSINPYLVPITLITFLYSKKLSFCINQSRIFKSNQNHTRQSYTSQAYIYFA